MSSSSCAADGPLARLLRASLACLWRESPAHHGALCRRLAGRAVALRLDDEILELRGEDGEVRVTTPRGATCRVRTTRTTILAVLDGRRTLLDAVVAEEVAIGGPLDDLLALHEALVEYVHGAVRAPSFPSLLQRLRNQG